MTTDKAILRLACLLIMLGFLAGALLGAVCGLD